MRDVTLKESHMPYCSHSKHGESEVTGFLLLFLPLFYRVVALSIFLTLKWRREKWLGEEDISPRTAAGGLAIIPLDWKVPSVSD